MRNLEHPTLPELVWLVGSPDDGRLLLRVDLYLQLNHVPSHRRSLLCPNPIKSLYFWPSEETFSCYGWGGVGGVQDLPRWEVGECTLMLSLLICNADVSHRYLKSLSLLYSCNIRICLVFSEQVQFC